MRVPQKIENEPYFHGLLPREDIKEMLRRNGEFLVRTTEPISGQPREFVLSVMCHQEREEGIKHFVIRKNPSGKYCIEKYSFESIPELVAYHWQRGEPVTKAGDVKLAVPITRQPWELQHEDIEVTKKLGEGAFGEVSMGRLRLRNGNKLDVAIKLAKLETLKKEQIKEIMREARLMRLFNHPNVVRLYGVAAGSEPLMLVMELADKGALDSFLQKYEQTPAKKMEICLGAAWGLEYLHKKEVIHRDIAARNCLFGKNRVLISDFGLTREGTVYQMDPKRRVPIRWLAPETLRTAMYTQKTDVWAYGIMCWEVYANGIEPYPGMTVAEVNFRVKDGYRMPLQDFMQPEMQNVVLKRCWPDSSNDRSSMNQICRYLERTMNVTAPSVDQSPRCDTPDMLSGANQIPAFSPGQSGNRSKKERPGYQPGHSKRSKHK